MQTNRGCPFSCTFCTEGEKYYSKVNKTSLDRKKEEFDYIVSHIKNTNTLRITDSNFGMYKEDEDFCEYIGEIQKKRKYPNYLSCSAGKNNKERLLRCNDLVGGTMRLTASVQSLNEDTLKNIKRKNISLDNILGLSDRISDTDTHSYSELILGLPGDSFKIQEENFKGLMDSGISNITQHQLSMLHGTEISSVESRRKYGIKTMFRPLQRSISAYNFLGNTLKIVEIEEICTSNSSMSFEDYLDSRMLYLTTGLFYNDRIFGEIHALLRILKLSTFGWVKLIHDNISNLDSSIVRLYSDFLKQTKGELFGDENELINAVIPNISEYGSGDIGGNLIYKYRATAYTKYFKKISDIAFKYLKIYIHNKGVNESVIENIARYSFMKKNNFIDTSVDETSMFDYDIYKLVNNVEYTRNGGSLEGLRYQTSLRFHHSDKHKKIINKQLEFYGNTFAGITMIIARFPVKKIFRSVEYVK